MVICHGFCYGSLDTTPFLAGVQQPYRIGGTGRCSTLWIVGDNGMEKRRVRYEITVRQNPKQDQAVHAGDKFHKTGFATQLYVPVYAAQAQSRGATDTMLSNTGITQVLHDSHRIMQRFDYGGSCMLFVVMSVVNCAVSESSSMPYMKSSSQFSSRSWLLEPIIFSSVKISS